MSPTSTKPTRRTPLQVAQDREETSRLNLLADLHVKRREVLNKYDVVETNKARRQAKTETGGEGEIYDMTRRLRGCNLGRDLERNYSPAKGIMHQFRVNVVGSLGKMQLNIAGGEEATKWFNEIWSPDCDFRSELHFSDWLGNSLGGAMRDGDQLTVFDDGVVEDSGKLLTWESDQVAPVSDNVLRMIQSEMQIPADVKLVQDNGILRDKWGREVAYISSGKRGIAMYDKREDVTVWPRKTGSVKLMRLPWRQNQGRGVPIMIASASNFLDLYELIASELMSAKRAAKQYGYVSREEAVANFDDPTADPEFLGENLGKTGATVDAEGANEATATGAKNYERFESFTGGYMDYISKGDTVNIPEIKHPNKEIAPFIDAVHGFSGSALGVASAYAKLRADKAYTAFRGDMVMTWVTWYWVQKILERMAADWVGIRALRWAMRHGKIANLAAGWEQSMSWTWPVMPEIDELKAAKAVEQQLKNGTTDWSKLLGPDWEKKLRSFGKQVNVVREILLPLGLLETKSGAPTTEEKTEDDEDETNEGE